MLRADPLPEGPQPLANPAKAGHARSRKGQPPRSWPPALFVLLIWLLALPLLWASLISAPQLHVDVGEWGDHSLLSGINAVERSDSESYRWTTGSALLALPDLSARYRLLRMRAHGWRPDGVEAPMLRLERAGRPLGLMQLGKQMRVYSVLLPPEASGQLTQLGLASEPIYYAPHDPRQLGFAIDWIALAEADRHTPPDLVQFGGQALLLGLGLLLLSQLALPGAWSLGCAALVATAQLWANFRQPLWIAQALSAWLVLAALLLLASLLLLPLLRRVLAPWASPAQASVAWALLVAALALRLGGASHPLFDAHDLPVHMRWLATVVDGELYLYSTPAELRNQQTFNPPGGYLLLLPLRLLLPDGRLTVQLGVALLDALGCLVLLALARELRLSAAAGLLAMALGLALPIGMTMLWWGFAANNIAQVGWLLLLWALLRTTRRPSPLLTAALAALVAFCLLAHAGAMVLTAAMLGVLLPLAWLRMGPASRRALLVAFGAAALFVVPVYLTAAAGPVLEQEVDPQKRSLGAQLAKAWNDFGLRLGLVGRGWLLGYLPPTLALVAPGLALLLEPRRRHPLLVALVAAWLLISLGFFAAYMSLGLLTRYIYFAAPLICLATGVLLAQLTRRPWGRPVVVALVLFVALGGASLWAEGIFLRVKPSVVPLSH
jgi:toxin CptA